MAAATTSSEEDCSGVVLEVEIELDEFDCPVWSQLTDDGEAGNENARGDEDSIVGPARDQFGKLIEAGGESLDDSKQLESLEVVRRRFTVRTALRSELPVEVLEEARYGANGPPFVAQDL